MSPRKALQGGRARGVHTTLGLGERKSPLMLGQSGEESVRRSFPGDRTDRRRNLAGGTERREGVFFQGKASTKTMNVRNKGRVYDKRNLKTGLLKADH